MSARPADFSNLPADLASTAPVVLPRAKNVLQIPLPTSVGFPLVSLVVVVPQQKQAVPSVPVAMRVKRGPVLVAFAKNALLVNFVPPTIFRQNLAPFAGAGTTKTNTDKPLATSAF